MSMRIVDVWGLRLSEIKIIRFARFADSRGFFAEHFRKSDFLTHPKLDFLKNVEFFQCNESYSMPGTIRGLHFQWNPYQGKLVRTLSGRMVDLVVDIRKGSSSFGKIIAYDMPSNRNTDFGEWIWVPPGFAHGNFFTQETHIEYFCSGEYNPKCEAGISPLALDIDWAWCVPELKEDFAAIVSSGPLMSEKDRSGYSLASWSQNPASDRFTCRS
jgi:dTDP-4-dehydrorhamnose 3,5-epimerase